MPSAHSADAPWSLIILAGGAGQRAGGADKGWMMWQGQPMIIQLLDRFATDCHDVIISANRHLDDYRALNGSTQNHSALNVTVVTDRRPDFAGPLAGIEAAIPLCSTENHLIIPCDMPALPADLPQQLLNCRQTPEDIAVAHDGIRQQHLCLALNGHYWLASLTDYLNQGQRSMHGWLTDKPVQQARFDDASGFANLNHG
ncbi:MAG: molybdenum cofactor guanylyltransferase [Gammaproteobacteria bacterium HGW-Gammaproteobacteria-14]|nr:MAG: molybdenum cofactor guanylyltransferase [Gammaproteobacteria bacterium HGW-Gammaproteobacteria-14]